MLPAGLSQFPIIVLLIDDQPIIGEAVRQMVADQTDVTFHHCADPRQALKVANEIRPTVILLDLVMPNVDGLTLVKFFRANPATRETPLIVLSTKEEPVVKAQAFALGANDYLVKLPDRIELLARIRYHSNGYIHLLERNDAYARLAESQQRMARELAAGVKYVRSLLPLPVSGPIAIDWRYVPCAELGGDTFGYHWLDGDRLAIYLLDVTGHGLDSALLAVSVMNVLRSNALGQSDACDPGRTLAALNAAFPMELYGNKSFTIWYGVYERSTDRLRWAGGGHPPALLLTGGREKACEQLESSGPMMGLIPAAEFETLERRIPAGSRLYVYSDGCHEIQLSGGGVWSFDEFAGFLSRDHGRASPLDRLHDHVRDLNGSEMLDDDFSIVELKF